MPYDEALAERVRGRLRDHDGYAEMDMFGGIAFLCHGNMAVGIRDGDTLVVRVGPDRFDEAMDHPRASLFDVTGRPMRGWVSVDPDGDWVDEDLDHWIEAGWTFARGLPPKEDRAGARAPAEE